MIIANKFLTSNDLFNIYINIICGGFISTNAEDLINKSLREFDNLFENDY